MINKIEDVNFIVVEENKVEEKEVKRADLSINPFTY